MEVDGSPHWDEDRQEQDEARDRWLGRQDVTVVRVPASAVHRDAGCVADSVLLEAEALLAGG